MATNYINVDNLFSGHPRFLKGVVWYYPVPDTLTRDQAEAAFLADPVRESKVVAQRPVTDGKEWKLKTATTNDGATWWLARNAAPEGQNGQVSTYYDAPAGLTLRSVLVLANGTVSERPMTEDPNGYSRPGVIDPARTGGLPKYAALHIGVPNGSVTARVVNAVTGKVLRQEAVTLTQTEPKTALRSEPPAPGSEEVPNPTPTPAPAEITMSQLRIRYQAEAGNVQVGVTGSAEYRYQVATPDRYSDAGRQNEQMVPDWNTIAWADVASGSGERLITAARRVNYTVLIRIQNKANQAETYDVPIRCIGGSYDWIQFSTPSANFIDMNAFTALPYDTLGSALTLTIEAGPTPDTVNLRIKSGFARDPNTRWYWWICGIPIFNRVDQDDWTYPVAKGLLVEVHRYVSPIRSFVEYNDGHPEDGGEVVTSVQGTGQKVNAGHIVRVDQMRRYIPA